MNAGFSNLKRLKAAVLPASMRSRVDWDEALVDLGLGVAEMIEGHCARKFAWSAEDTHLEDAHRTVISLPRYPVASIDEVELQSEVGGAWDDIAGQVTRQELRSGVVQFRDTPGGEGGTVRVTYSGGFWWDTDEYEGGTMPEGAQALPRAVFSAWVLQVQAIAQARDLFGTAGGAAQAKGRDNAALLPEAHLIPVVLEMLKPFRRFAA
jgi:hypothetical protein